MDQVDRTLLEALRANARVSFAELSRAVGLSAPAVQERVRRLEAAGVITGYHAAVAPASLGLGVSAVVSIYQTDSAEQGEVSDRLAEVDEVDNCWFVAGDEAFVVTVRAADVASLEPVLGKLRRIRGVARTRTTVVLSTKWEGRVRTMSVPDQAESPAS